MTAGDTKKQPNRASRIPTFANRQEEAEWWDTHDLTDYWDQLEPVKVKFNLEPMESITFSLDAHNTKRLRDAAKRRGFPLETLIQIWLPERLEHEDRAREQQAP
jgi:hypothetical protein